MANKRMFAMTILDSDAFLDMPLSAQALYLHLNMRADDDGFINNPKKIQRLIGAHEDDLKLLLVKRFLLSFENGVIVIKHWKMHNTIQKDRYTETVYSDEKKQLSVKPNKAYTLLRDEIDVSENPEISTPVTDCKQIGNGMETECIQNVSTGLGLDIGLDIDIDSDKEKSAPTSNEVYAQTLLPEAIPDAIYEIPLQSTKDNPKFHAVTTSDLEHYAELYPAVDVHQQIRNMIGWCEANPEKRKTARGAKAFIARWLANEQDKGGKRGFSSGGRSSFSSAIIDVARKEIENGQE